MQAGSAEADVPKAAVVAPLLLHLYDQAATTPTLSESKFVLGHTYLKIL